MRTGLKGRSRWVAVSLLAVVGAVLLAVGVVGLVGGADGNKVEPFGTISAPTTSTGTPTPSVTVRTITETPTATPIPTPTPSTSPIARMIIEKAGTDAEVQVKGLDKDYVMEVPDTPYLVAWYEFTGYPGYGKNAVFSAHVDWYPNIQGAFWGLRNLQADDIVRVILQDGTEYRYRVTAKAQYDADNVPMDDVLRQEQSKEVITLITCGGRFVKDSQGLGSYLDRLVVQAEIVDDNVSAAGG